MGIASFIAAKLAVGIHLTAYRLAKDTHREAESLEQAAVPPACSTVPSPANHDDPGCDPNASPSSWHRYDGRYGGQCQNDDFFTPSAPTCLSQSANEPRTPHSGSAAPALVSRIGGNRSATLLGQHRHCIPRATPKRAVRVLVNQTGDCSGRLVISGRMADVCAELERLAAFEH